MLRRLFDSPRTYFVLAVLLILAAIASQVRVTFPSRPAGTVDDLASLASREPNVVFILIDTLRADRLSAYGYERPTTPVLETLAAGGIRFARTESQSTWTKASMASLWTGLFPVRTGVLRFNDALPEAATLPAEIFQEAGYTTAGIWRNGWVATNFGFAQGFDTYLRPTPRTVKHVRRAPRGATQVPGTDEDATIAAIEFLRNHRDEKFMLYIHYMDAHQYVYDEIAAELDFGVSFSDAYDRAIRWTDRNLGVLFATLDELDLSRRTLVVIGSDHGEAFLEHRHEGHARDLYREVVDVPLLFIPPFRLPEEVVVEPVVRNVDIWPTILDLVGLPPLPQADGISLVPLIEEAARGEAPETPPSFSYIDQTWGRSERDPAPLIAARHGSQRVILSLLDPDETREIYDHDVDPGELRSLVADPPAWAGPLEERLLEQSEEEPPWEERKQVEIDDLYREQLRALGYVIN